jgi:hypothetical protein
VIGVFKQKSPGNIVILAIFGLLLKLPLFIYPKTVVSSVNDGQLYRWLIHALPPDNAWVSSFLAFGLLYVQSLLVNYLVNEYRMIARHTFLPAMAFLLVTSLLPEWNYFSAPLLANTFIIWIFINLFKLYNASNARAQIFNIGLITGICSYIYFPSVAFALCIMLGLMILKPFQLNELVLFLLGFLTPYYFYGTYLFLTSQLSLVNFLPHVSVKIPNIKSTIWLAASTLLLTIPFLLGGYYVQTHLRKMLIQVRKNWSILLLYLLLAFFVPFINSDQSFHTWVLVTTPFATFHACAYFYAPKRWLPLLLFYLTVGFVLFEQYQTPLWH